MSKAQKSTAVVVRSLREERIDMRVDADRKRLLEQGAALRGLSLTDFMVQSASQAAEQLIRDQQLITLTLAGQQAFIEALSNPPAPNETLQNAFRRYKERSGDL